MSLAFLQCQVPFIEEENLFNSSTRWELCNSLIHFAVCYFHYQEGIKLHNSSSWITCIPLVQSQSSCFHTDHTCPQRLLAYTDSDHQHHTEDSQNLQFNHIPKLLYCKQSSMQNWFHEKIVLSFIPFLIPLNNLITFKNGKDQKLNTVKFESNTET